jgi:hypothetical protein
MITTDHLSPGPPYLKQNSFEKEEHNAKTWPRVRATGWLTIDSYVEAVGYSVYYNRIARPIIPTGYYVDKALASLNPNVPQVDVPLFLFELREYPRMLKHLGDLLRGKPGSIAETSIAYQFGWAPLIGDLHKLANLVELVEKSRDEIERLKSSEPIEGTLESYPHSWTGSTKRRNLAGGRWYESHSAYTNTRKAWFSARLEPQFSSPVFREGGLQTLQRALGGSLSASTLWNAIPWSWLIDYFIGVSAYLEANRGVLPYAVDTICIMVNDECKATRQLTAANGFDSISISPGEITSSYKSRSVHITPSAGFHFKSNPLTGKLGVLTSLAVAMAFRGKTIRG